MHTQAIQNIVDKMGRVVELVKLPFIPGEKSVRVMNRGGIVIYFSEECNNALIKVLLQLLKTFGNKFSSDYINNALCDLLVKIVIQSDSTKLSDYVNVMIFEFENYSTEHIVFVPLSGIKMDQDRLLIDKFVLRKMTPEVISDLLQKFYASVQNESHPPEMNDAIIHEIMQSANRLQGTICLEFTVLADPQKAHELAQVHAKIVVNLLRYSIPALASGRSEKVTIGIDGEPSLQVRELVIISSDYQNFQLDRQFIHHTEPLHLSDTNLQIMKDLGVFDLAYIYAKANEISPFEEILLRSLDWFANSQIHVVKANRYLSLITCLETFFASQTKEGMITTTVAEGVAITISDNLAERLEIVGQVKNFYATRSSLSHGNKGTDLDINVSEVENIACRMLREMTKLSKEFESIDHYNVWLTEQRLKP